MSLYQDAVEIMRVGWCGYKMHNPQERETWCICAPEWHREHMVRRADNKKVHIDAFGHEEEF